MPKSVIATWPFSDDGVRAAVSNLQRSGSLLDAVEAGIKVVELDPEVKSVGYGGLPTSGGRLELDAALMCSWGPLGSVMGVRGYGAAIPAARAVLEHSAHSILCGTGAVEFCRAHGLHPASPDDALLTDHARRRYAEFLACPSTAPRTHHSAADGMTHTDTVGMLACDGDGHSVAGCATSGMPFKSPGRVGDSPVFGAGLYAAPGAGAATASGDGDQMLRFCLAFVAVERMRAGDTADQAAHEAMRRVTESAPKCQAAIVTVDARGHVGAAATHDGFTAMAWTEKKGFHTLKPTGLEKGRWEHQCV